MGLLRALDVPPVWTLAHMGIAALHASVWAMRFPGQRVAGAILVAGGVLLAAWAVVVMARARTAVMPRREPAVLVKRGPFGFTRNPIYLGDLLVLVGWCLLISQPLAAILVVPLYLVLDRRFVTPEEMALAAKFGTAFEDYASRVPRWL